MLKIAAKYVCGRGSARTPLWELTALPRLPSCIGGGEEKGREWKAREDRKGEERRQERAGRGEGKTVEGRGKEGKE